LLRILGPKTDEVTEGSRTLLNEELHNIYSSLSIMRVIIKGGEIVRACRTHGSGEKCVQNFCQKT
jgi:hypothetical protein